MFGPPWARARRRGCCSDRHHPRDHGFSGEGEGEFAHRGFGPPGGRHGGGGEEFGVRRPLRFLAHKLELTDEQVGQFARILDDLKTERAQAAVDDRRTLADFADAVAGASFDAQRVAAGTQRRADSSVRVRDAVAKALQHIHALLDPVQRGKLSYLIRSGVLSL